MSSSLNALVLELERSVQSGNLAAAKQTLRQAKLAMVTDPAATVPQCCAALEWGVLLAVAEGDLEGFGRNMAQLQPYYGKSLVHTPRKAHVMGLNLMHLLVENRLSEFHSELEVLLTADEQQQQQSSEQTPPPLSQSPLIQFPIALERQLMVGMYDEVLTKPIPDPSYQFFMDHLQQTVRDSIADCIEVSYKTLSLQDAASMMKFDSVAELQEYMTNYRDDWIVESETGVLQFQPPSTTTLQATDIPSMEWIQQSLTYATEMERIV